MLMGAKLTKGKPVIVNFMYQLGWVTVPRYLVKYYPGCFREGFFLYEINLSITEL